MGAAKNIAFLDLNTSAQQLIASVTEEQAQIGGLGFFYPVGHGASVLVLRLISEVDGIKNAQLGEAVAALLDLDAIEQGAWRETDAITQGRQFGPFFPEKVD